MGNCIVVVQFDLPKRTEEQAVKAGMSSAPIYRGLAANGLIRKDYLNGDGGTGGFTSGRAALPPRNGSPRIAWLS